MRAAQYRAAGARADGKLTRCRRANNPGTESLAVPVLLRLAQRNGADSCDREGNPQSIAQAMVAADRNCSGGVGDCGCWLWLLAPRARALEHGSGDDRGIAGCRFNSNGWRLGVVSDSGLRVRRAPRERQEFRTGDSGARHDFGASLHLLPADSGANEAPYLQLRGGGGGHGSGHILCRSLCLPRAGEAAVFLPVDELRDPYASP